jgi:hypothetical protein
MKISDDEYKKLEDGYIKEQYKLQEPKPNGMMGHWGFYAVKKREFKEKMIKESRIEKI